MIRRIDQTKWLKYLFEALTLTLILGIFGGIVIGLLRSWKYISKGLFLLSLDILSLSIDYSLLVAFLFLLLYLFLFLALYRVIRRVEWTCFLAGAVSCIPFFLFFGYGINQINGIYRSNFFTREAFIFNLKIGLGFVFLWFLVSMGLFFWTRSRILKTSTLSIRGLGLLLSTVLVLNIAILSFYKLYATDSPNVIILLIDALRADHLSCYGYSRNTTPNIDEFAKGSVIFTQAISQSTYTKTSIASLFTSRYPYEHGVYENEKDSEGDIHSDILSAKETTLAEALLQNGFLTMAWLEQTELRAYMGFSQGFVEYNEQQGRIQYINQKFIKWLNGIGKKHKFFAYIHIIDLHDPYRPEPPYDTMYGVYSDVYAGNVLEKANYEPFLRAIREGKRKLEKRDVDQLIAYYDGLLTYTDSQIGLLLEELKKAGLYDNTLIILTADHGDGFMKHGFVSHLTTPYDGLLHVPLIIKFPKSVYAGRVVKNQVRLIDVMPTILDFLKIKTDSKLEGFSLLNYLDANKRNGNNFPKYAYSEVLDRYDRHYLTSIRTERFKYIDFPGKKDEFYDLIVDPKEQNNIIDSKRDEAEKFHKMALAIALEREKKKKEVGKVILDKKAVEELKALGYIQ